MDMSTLLWVLAALDLIGGIIIGSEIDNMIVGITIGVVGFAILGGFATVISLLQEISSNTSDLKNTSTRITELEKHFKLESEAPSTDYGTNSIYRDGYSIDRNEEPISEPKSFSAGFGINPKGKKAVYPIPSDENNMVLCPKCKTKQKANRHLCQNCGTPFMYDE